MRCQFWGPLSFHHLHLGAYPVLSSPPQAPCQAAKPPAAPYPPAPSRPQRPPSHLPESGPTAHWARGWGPPGGPRGVRGSPAGAGASRYRSGGGARSRSNPGSWTTWWDISGTEAWTSSHSCEYQLPVYTDLMNVVLKPGAHCVIFFIFYY